MGQPVIAGVGDLDTEGPSDDVEQELEVPAGDAAVGRGVACEFRDDERRRVQWESPGPQLFGGEQAGQAGAAWGGGQQDAEAAHGAVGLGEWSCGGGEFLIHVTQRGRTHLP